MNGTGGTRSLLKGTLFGAIAGIIDVIPMIMMGLSWDADLSAFSLWVVSGLLIAATDLPVRGWLKGLIISFLVLLPCAILMGAKEPASLVPIGAMTLVLGSCLGHCIEKYAE